LPLAAAEGPDGWPHAPSKRLEKAHAKVSMLPRSILLDREFLPQTLQNLEC
jgi:hypothetical protein